MIYLDNASTTPIDNEVIKLMNNINKNNYGNPSSLHQIGENARIIINNSRKVIAKAINANYDEIIFTSGGTESNNMAIKSIAFTMRNSENKKHIITSKIEHPSVYKACDWLKQNGFEISYITVDKNGLIHLEELEEMLKAKKTSIVSIIHANNEIGTIQDIAKISKIVHKHNALLHIDSCQSFTKVNIDVKKLNVDLITLNAHKIHGPKGIGALFISNNVKNYIKAWQHGGGQEFKLRAGTENVSAIAGFAKAVEINKNNNNISKIKNLRDYFVRKVLAEIAKSKLNGPPLKDRLVNNANISFKSVEGEAILLNLNIEGIAVSTGSACSSSSLDPSHVLTSIGLSHEQAHGSIRFSFSKNNTKKEIDLTVKKLKKIITKLRKMSPFWKED